MTASTTRSLGVVLGWLLLPSLLWAQAPDLPFGIALPPSLNFATSPNPVGSGARAVGQGTAFIAVADDATAASHNPGGLIQLERPELSMVGSYFLGFERPEVTQPSTVVASQTLEAFHLNYASVAYPFHLWQRNMIVSLNFQRLFDLRGATDVASRLSGLEGVSGVQQVRSRQRGGLFTLSPAMAVQITPSLSVGVAFNWWPDVLDNGWEQTVAVAVRNGRVASGPDVVPFDADGRIEERYAFTGFNVTAGFFWAIDAVWTLGGVVRSPFRATVTHTHRSSLTVTVQGAAPVTTALSFRETLDMDMPLAYGLGLSARLSDSLTLSIDVSRIHWSDFRLEASTRADSLLVENGAPSGKGEVVLSGGADDVTSVRLGAEYLWILPKSVIAFRAGLFYDPEPGAGPPDEFVGFSLGTGLAIKQFVVDVAYTFRTGLVKSDATDTTVYQHTFLSSIIYHF